MKQLSNSSDVDSAPALFVCLLVIIYCWDIPVSPPVPGLVAQSEPWRGPGGRNTDRRVGVRLPCLTAAARVSPCRCGETSRRFSRRSTAAPPT